MPCFKLSLLLSKSAPFCLFKGILWNAVLTEGICLFALNLQSMDSARTLASGVEQNEKEALDNFNICSTVQVSRHRNGHGKQLE